MNATVRTLLTWVGRIALLFVPFVLIAGLSYPSAVQFLNPIACDEGLTLDVQRNNPDTPFDNRVVCDSEDRMVDAKDRIYLMAGGAFAIAVMAYLLRSKITPRSLSAPRAAPQHA